MLDVLAALADLPAVFDLADARARGLSARVVERAVRRHLVHRLAPGLFVAFGTWQRASRRERHLLSVGAAGRLFPADAISHHSAALLHGLPSPLVVPDWVSVTTDGSPRTATRGGVARLEPAHLAARQVEEVSGMSVTTVARTVVDCLRSLPLPDAVAVGDAALRSGVVDREELGRVRRDQRGWPYITRADDGIAILDPARENWFESFSFTRLWQLGIALPEPQVWVYDERGHLIGRVDGLWHEYGVVAEADGKGKYLGEFDSDGPSSRAAARRVYGEKVREDQIRASGLEVVRWDRHEMVHAPALVARRVAGVCERGDIGRFRGHFVSSSPRLVAPKPPNRRR